MTRKRTAVLISGRGSNLSALLAASADPAYPAEIVLVLSNVASAGGLEIARASDVPTAVVSHKDYDSRESFDAAITAELKKARVDLVCEAGFMRIHSDAFTREWEGRLLNIHPSLLPAFKGIKVHEQVLAAGVPATGCTVHFIVTELDSGPIVLQSPPVPVAPGDTPETLAARVLEAEHRIYPEALALVARGKARLERGRVVFS
jgi:phosphoribosylglycinamide formyltransferase-1